MSAYPIDYNPILEYWGKIQSGEEIVSDKIRRTYKKIVSDLSAQSEYIYYPQKANHIIAFIESYCRHSKGKMGGQKIVLELWEKAMLATIFGFADIEGNRKYREAVLIVGKKNGKSLLSSAVGLYLMIADGEAGPEVVSVASKRDQAKIIWLESRRMVRKSPFLMRKIKTLVAEMDSDFNDGVFKPLASDSDTLDGLNIHGGMMDEIHAWKNGKALYDIIADGTSAREQPLIFITTTAGTVREDIYDMKYDEAERVINGYGEKGYKDEHFIAFIYELDNRKEWTDLACWKKANPGLGTIKNLKTLSAKVEKAKANPLLVKNLLCKEFNIRETTSEAWLTFEQLNNTATFDIAKLKPRYGILGIDLSSTTDLTCATLLFKVKDDETVYLKQMYWLPSDLIEQRTKEDKIPYQTWYEMGLMRTSEGNKVNYKDVTAWCKEVQEQMDCYIYKIGYDSWGATYLVDELQQMFGKESTEAVIQGAKTFSSPLARFAADLTSKRINYNNNPIFKWNLSNAAIQVDRNANMALVKTSNARKRIDGVASAMDAYIVFERNQENYLNMI